jgi:hypothetical protein
LPLPLHRAAHAVVSPDGRRPAAIAESADLSARPSDRSSPMAKGQQRSNKEAKKPKKDAAVKPPKAGAPPITTSIIERGKKKS